MTGRCPECGAPPSEGETCADLFNRMLALEWTVIGETGAGIGPSEYLSTAAGAKGVRAHFFAVGSYQMQHPDRLEPKAVLGLLDGMEDVLAGRAFVGDIRLRARRAFDGPRDPALGPWPDHWAVTVAECCDVPPSDYFDAVRRWAEATPAAIRAVRAKG